MKTTEEYLKDFQEETHNITVLFHKKNQMYDNSFFIEIEKNLSGAYYNLKRKMVRIEQVLNKANMQYKNFNDEEDSLLDALDDLAVYALMTKIAIKEHSTHGK